MIPERARGDRLLAELSVDYLTQPGVEVARMFASDGLRVHGKFFAFIGRDGRLVLKLPEKRVSELIDAGVASRVTIRNRSGRGLPIPQGALIPQHSHIPHVQVHRLVQFLSAYWRAVAFREPG